MSRYFNGSAGFDEYITLGPGILADGGPITVLVYWRPEESHFGGLLQGRASGSTQWAVFCDGGSYFTPNDFSGFAQLTVGEWQIVGYSKASGSVAVRWHHWDSTGGWTHADGATEADGSAVDEIRLGEWDGARLDGEWVCAAVWNSELSDAAVESAASSTALQDWFDASPDALWAGDQASTSEAVEDLTGNGADQTATLDPAVDADEPPGWSYTISSGTSANAEAAAATASGQAATIQVDSGAEAAAGTGTVPQPSAAVAPGAEVGSAAAAAQDAAVLVQKSAAAEAASATATGNPATASAQPSAEAAAGAGTAHPPAPTLTSTADAAAATAAGQDTTGNVATNAAAGAATATGQDATVSTALGTSAAAEAATATATAYAATSLQPDTPTERTLTLAADDRTLAVVSDDRTYTVTSDDRVFEVAAA